MRGQLKLGLEAGALPQGNTVLLVSNVTVVR